MQPNREMVMTPPDGPDRKISDKTAERRRREAEALRENLKRRKAQTRARAEAPKNPAVEDLDGDP